MTYNTIHITNRIIPTTSNIVPTTFGTKGIYGNPTPNIIKIIERIKSPSLYMFVYAPCGAFVSGFVTALVSDVLTLSMPMMPTNSVTYIMSSPV